GFPETRLLGSACAGAGHGPWERMILISPSVKPGFAARSCSAALVPAENAQAAPSAARIANRLFSSRPETMESCPPCRSRRAIISSAPARRGEAPLKESLMRFFAAAALAAALSTAALLGRAQGPPARPRLVLMP